MQSLQKFAMEISPARYPYRHYVAHLILLSMENPMPIRRYADASRTVDWRLAQHRDAYPRDLLSLEPQAGELECPPFSITVHTHCLARRWNLGLHKLRRTVPVHVTCERRLGRLASRPCGRQSMNARVLRQLPCPNNAAEYGIGREIVGAGFVLARPAPLARVIFSN
jgi:hypothetical protein